MTIAVIPNAIKTTCIPVFILKFLDPREVILNEEVLDATVLIDEFG